MARPQLRCLSPSACVAGCVREWNFFWALAFELRALGSVRKRSHPSPLLAPRKPDVPHRATSILSSVNLLLPPPPLSFSPINYGADSGTSLYIPSTARARALIPPSTTAIVVAPGLLDDSLPRQPSETDAATTRHFHC